MLTEMLRGSMGTLGQDGNLDALTGIDKKRNKALNNVAPQSDQTNNVSQRNHSLYS